MKSPFRKREKPDYSFRGYPHLKDIKPKERYVFHSDYFEVDSQYASILSFFHVEGASDNFGAFWGINRIPSGLSDDVSIVLFEQTRRMTEGWLADHQSRSEGIAELNENEQAGAGSNTSRGKASRKSYDLQVIAQELQDGAAYLHVQYRLLVKAPTLVKLDEAIDKIERQYIDRFATLSAAPYIGEQRSELSRLFLKNEKKIGKGFYFTSTEFAGSYSLVTHGLEDPTGEYIGNMYGDVNNSAVLFDMNKYGHHCVIADENFDRRFGRARVSDIWGSKISQACLLNNHRVVHLILNGADLDRLGPSFSGITTRIDMNQGDVNMFEMFGSRKDQLAIFPSQIQKITLMAEQTYESNDHDRGVIRGSLSDILQMFYMDKGMWYRNAKQNLNRLRVVGIPHEEVPVLAEFVTYLDMEYKAISSKMARDNEKVHALNILRASFQQMLDANGDLFNQKTKSSVDHVREGRRVIYDFSKLERRGDGVVMAQLVNIVGFAVGTLSEGDTVIIHGTERISPGVKAYITRQFQSLHEKGGRVCYLYNNMDAMLADKAFSAFDKADFTIFGNMTESFAAQYQKELGQEIPPDLSKLVTNRSETMSYIRRGVDNVVFRRDLLLGLSKAGRR